MSDTVQSLLDETFALQHYGVKGQKWGQRNYQNPDGTYTELGKERRRVGYKKEDGAEDEPKTKIGGKAYKDMTRKERRAARRKARHNEAERRERREFNRDKADAIQNGDLDFVNKHLDKFSNEEIATVVNRYKTMQIIRDMDAADKAKKRKNADHYIDKAIHYLEKAGDVTAAVTRIRDKINTSNQTAANAKKAQLDYDKALHPDKYEKKKSAAQLEKEALDLQTARDNARKAKASADQIEQNARLALLNANKADPDYLEKKEAARKAKEEAEFQAKELERAEKKAKENKELQKEIERQEKADAKAEKAEEKARKKEIKSLSKELGIDKDEAENLLDNFDPNESAASIVDRYYKDSKSNTKSQSKSNIPAENDNDDGDYYTRLMDSYYSNMYPYGSAKRRSLLNKVLGTERVEDYKSYKPNKNYSYDLGDLNKESQKAIKKISKEKPEKVKNGDYAQDKQWTKDMKKHDSRIIDKWVEDIKKKYIRERNMDPAAAEKKAEEYVDAWIDAYDEGRIKV